MRWSNTSKKYEVVKHIKKQSERSREITAQWPKKSGRKNKKNLTCLMAEVCEDVDMGGVSEGVAEALNEGATCEPKQRYLTRRINGELTAN
jgi:hypothetical protein